MLARCPATMSEAQVEEAGRAVARAAKKAGVRVAVKPTKMHTTPAAEKVAAAHGMSVQELANRLAAFEAQKAKRQAQVREAVRRHRAKQQAKSK